MARNPWILLWYGVTGGLALLGAILALLFGAGGYWGQAFEERHALVAASMFILLGLLLWAGFFVEIKNQKRKDKAIREELSPFAVERGGRRLSLSFERSGELKVCFVSKIGFRSYHSSGQVIDLDVARELQGFWKSCFGPWPSGPKMKLGDDGKLRTKLREVLKKHLQNTPPLRSQYGVIRVKDEGLEYREGPYYFGAMADEGIIGHPAMIDALYEAAFEIEDIWRTTR